MIVAAVQFYDVVVWLHISSIVVAFGPSFGYAVFQTVAERHDPRSIPTVMRSFTVIDRYVLTPGAILLIATGVYLTIDRWDFGDVFVSVGIVVIVALLGVVHGFFVPRERKLAELARRDIEGAGGGEVTLSEEYQQLSMRTGLIGTLSGVAVIITIYFMAAKPFL